MDRDHYTQGLILDIIPTLLSRNHHANGNKSVIVTFFTIVVFRDQSVYTLKPRERELACKYSLILIYEEKILILIHTLVGYSVAI